MKLQILVPQYNETDEIIKPLLDSIMVQQNVDFNEVGVVICNDGSGVRLSEKLLDSYPFKVEYHICGHRGVSATRNACLDRATAEYVMFCDADDMFCNTMGLFIIFREMGIDGGFDTFVSVFTEETRDKDGGVIYINREHDQTFVHGKVHRRQYLIENGIRWNEDLTIHEDSYFNCLCQKLLPSAERGRYCPVPFYLWKWRDDSVCRHDRLYLNRTYTNMLDSNTALVNRFLERDREKEARFFATMMVYDAYYSFNCDRWWTEEGRPFLHDAELRFRKYWNDFRWLFEKNTKQEQMAIVSGMRNRFFQEGLILERITFSDWIRHIEELEE